MSVLLSGKINASSIKLSTSIILPPITVYAGYNGLYKLNDDGKTFTTLANFNIAIQSLTNNNTLMSNGKYGIVSTSNTTFKTAGPNWTNIKDGVYPSGVVNGPPSMINGYFYQVISNSGKFQLYQSIDGIAWNPYGPVGSFTSGRTGNVFSMNGNICVGLVASGSSLTGWYLSNNSWVPITGTPNPTSYAKVINGAYFKGTYYIPSGYDEFYYKGTNLGTLAKTAYNLKGLPTNNSNYNWLEVDQFIVSGNNLIGLCSFSNPSPTYYASYAYQIPFAAIKSTDGINWTGIPINDTTGTMKWSRSIMNHIIYTDSAGNNKFVVDTVQASPGANKNTYGLPNYYAYLLNGDTISYDTSFIQLPLNELITGICYNL